MVLFLSPELLCHVVGVCNTLVLPVRKGYLGLLLSPLAQRVAGCRVRVALASIIVLLQPTGHQPMALKCRTGDMLEPGTSEGGKKCDSAEPQSVQGVVAEQYHL